MEKSFDETLSKLEIFFSGTIKSYPEIFSALKKLFYFENGKELILSRDRYPAAKQAFSGYLIQKSQKIKKNRET